MSELYNSIKKIAGDFDANKISTSMLFGTVVSANPLSIKINDKIILPKKFLVVAQHLTDYTIECEITTEEIDGFFVEHEGRHDVEVEPGWQKGRIKLLNHLKDGEKVIMARMEGGNHYIVIDRLPEGM